VFIFIHKIGSFFLHREKILWLSYFLNNYAFGKQKYSPLSSDFKFICLIIILHSFTSLYFRFCGIVNVCFILSL
jgi:hypothetical protein